MTDAGASPSAPLAQTRDPWTPAVRRTYSPMVQTLRIYAGWFLVWYGVFLVLYTYATLRSLTFLPDIVREMASSFSLFLGALACFLFLLLQDLHRVTGRKAIFGFLLGFVGGMAFVVYFLNVR